MRFDLTPASHRVLERASQLRLQRGIAAISFAKLLWALFEEEECRAAQWLREADLSLEQFLSAFGVQMLQSPISAPPFPMGTYGITPGQHSPSAPASANIRAAQTDNTSAGITDSYSGSRRPYESENEQQEEQQGEQHSEQEDEQEEQPQDIYTPTEPPKYSLYSQQQKGRRTSDQSRLQFYLDDQWINIGLLTPELEDCLVMVVQRLARQDQRHSISVSGGVKQVAMGMSAFTLLTEHLLLAVVLDTGDVGRWIRENGFEPAELYRRIETNQEHHTEAGIATTWSDRIELSEEPDTPQHYVSGLHEESLHRIFDAAANRAREAIRVIEDYVRFILDDAGLTQRLKTFRHQFQDVLQQFPMQLRLAARNTEYDVGTEISAAGEYLRPTISDLLSANFSRLQESLRSLEEFSKMFDPLIARQFEQLRYQGYTLHKDVALLKSRGHTPPDNIADELTRGHKPSILEDTRLYALVDTRTDEATFTQFLTAIIAGGVDVIQLRDKQADDRTLLARSRILKECIAASERKVLFIMNDRPDLAVLAEADGVHVGQEELPVALVRQIVGTMLIGVSTHSIDQARQAVRDGADYIGVGPVFESATKEFSQFPGLEFLQEVAAEITIPAFAIGGIVEDRLNEVFQTGVCRIAVSSVLLQAENPEAVAERLSAALTSDTVESLP